MNKEKLNKFLKNWEKGLLIFLIVSLILCLTVNYLSFYFATNHFMQFNHFLSFIFSFIAMGYMLFRILDNDLFEFNGEWKQRLKVSLLKTITFTVFITILLFWNICSSATMTYQEYKRETKIETYESDEEYIEDEDIIYNAISTENGIKHKYEFCSEVNVCGIYYSDKKIEEAAEYQVNFQKETLKFPNNKKSKIVSYQLLFLDDKPTTIPEKSKEELFKENYQEYKIDNDYAYLWSNLILSYTYIIYSILCGQLFYVKYKVSCDSLAG